jgi:hypothetical protein
MSRKPLTDKTGEVRELQREDIRAMRSATEVLPAELVGVFCGPRCPGRRFGNAATKALRKVSGL